MQDEKQDSRLPGVERVLAEPGLQKGAGRPGPLQGLGVLFFIGKGYGELVRRRRESRAGGGILRPGAPRGLGFRMGLLRPMKGAIAPPLKRLQFGKTLVYRRQTLVGIGKSVPRGEHFETRSRGQEGLLRLGELPRLRIASARNSVRGTRSKRRTHILRAANQRGHVTPILFATARNQR